MRELASILLPELILIAVACVLFLVGVSTRASARRLAPVLALATLAGVFAMQVWTVMQLGETSQRPVSDAWRARPGWRPFVSTNRRPRWR